jgi:hypothetical protein
MATIAGVVVKELMQDLAEGVSVQGGPHATKSYLVPNWTDRYTVANALLFRTTLSGGVGGSIAFQRPASYPDSTNMFAQDISIRGLGRIHQGANQIAFDSAIVTVNYGRTPYNQQQTQDPGGLNSFDPAAPMVYASQELDYSAQVIELKPGTCGYYNGAITIPLNVGVPYFIDLVTMHLTLHKLPYLLPTAFRAKVGSINNAPFFGCATGTLRWDGAKTGTEFLSDGSQTQNTQMTFVHRPAAPWDCIIDPTGATMNWYQVRRPTTGGTSILANRTIDFTTLIPSAYLGVG